MKRVAIVGFDHLHAVAYLEVLSAHADVELVGICDDGINREIATVRAGEAGVPFSGVLTGYLDWNVDGIYVGTTPIRHRDVVETAATNGIHVIRDKPLATTLEDADAIQEVVERWGIGLSVPFRPVFQRPVALTLERLRSGMCGEVRAIYAVKYGRLPTASPVGMDAGWFLDPEVAGFGGFGDIGSHAIDALCRIAGSSPTRVYARTASTTGRIDDLGTAHLEFANGVHAVLSAGWVNPLAAPRWLEVRFEILTDTHAFVVSAPYREIEIVTAERRQLIPWESDDLNGHIDDFVAAMSGLTPTVTAADARTNLAVLVAAYRSAETADPVEIVT